MPKFINFSKLTFLFPNLHFFFSKPFKISFIKPDKEVKMNSSI